MSPPLALFLCIDFIAWLLVRDFKSRTSVSPALWLPTLLLLIIGSRPVSLWFGAGLDPNDFAEGSPLDRAIYLSLIAASWIVATCRRVKWSNLITANIGITLFYLYFGISVLWSDYSFVSFKRWFKDFGSVFVILVVLTQKDPLEAIRALYVRCACVMIPLSVVFIKYYPDLGRAYSIGGVPMATGVGMQKNSLGEMVMVFSLFVTWDYLEARSTGVKKLLTRIPW